MKMITSFDPTAATSGSFDHKVSNPCGGVYLFNESNVWLQLRMPGGGYVGLPAWWSRFYRLDQVLEPIQWQELATISTVSSPLSQVYGEAYESSELKNRSFYDGPIPRNPYIANSVSSTVSTNQVINDGNPATTTVVEATQSGNSSGSNLFFGNDGSFYVAQLVSSVYNKYFQGVIGANPYLELGAKAVLKWLDQNGNNLSTILGITGAGGTFLQAHSTANNVQIKDKNANTILEVLGNNTTIQGCDSSFNLANILGVDSSGNTFIQSHTNNNATVIYDKNGNELLRVVAGGAINFSTSSTTINGGSNGSAVHWMPFQGSAFKMLIIKESNFQTAGSNQDYALPTAFTNGAMFITGSCVTWSFVNAGSVQSCNVVTGIGSAAFQSTVGSYTFGNLAPNVAFDTIRHTSGAGTAHSGWIIIIGN